MWLLLVALCLAQGLGDAVPCTGVSHDNPEQFMNISQIICFHGYRSKEHQVPTDGYFLAMNRIPGGREEAGSRGPMLPVLPQHGLVLDGSNWVSTFSNNSLGFIPADARYDFWIRNSCSNSWSLQHLNLSVSQEEFWDFSFHEMSMYDLPTTVGFIPMKTGQEKLFYVGHAQGSSLGFMVFLSMPQLAEKIKIFFVVGPAYTLCTDKGPVLSLFYLPHAIIKGTGKPTDLPEMRGWLPQLHQCWPGTTNRPCPCPVAEPDMYISHFPDYTSTKNLLHWGQTAKTGEFKQFDYGEKNQEKYSQTSPPFYRIEDMTVPTALWSGREDWFTSTLETQCLLLRITNLVHHEHFPDWNH